MSDCLFCKIIANEIPAEIVAETDNILAFHDIDPKAPTHILVIPKKHIATLNDIALEDLPIIGELTHTAAQIAKQQGFDEDGYRVVMNCNEDGGQTVYHIHMHVLAGRPLQWPPG
ncbi:MAG: histidine triad nucleotide-binding protein [Pseudomonadota bacterium]|nr:histidine triad nucleotide-binding protein [Pseudomonadota bacterium]